MQKTVELFDLHGRSAIVTGSARGIGRAIALRLADAGASVVVTDIAQDACEAVAAEITAAGRLRRPPTCP
jgi:NAD(P)-dependent dehydrogenase (short-subunit alcohol dehydrogenase family)